MKRWYAVQTHLHAEDRAVVNMAQQGFETYLPKYLKRRRHARKVERVAVPLFPRYAFVKVDLEAERWRALHSTIGVTRLVCNGDAPAPVPDVVIEEIRGRESPDGCVVLFDAARFKPGDRVTVVDGALADQTGIFQCLDDKQRVVVLLSLLGRQVRLSLAQDLVAAA